jgi:hypothetical protein
MKHVIFQDKLLALIDADGMLTRQGMRIAHDYAVDWVDRTVRNLSLERAHPEMADTFYDIRADRSVAHIHYLPETK